MHDVDAVNYNCSGDKKEVRKCLRAVISERDETIAEMSEVGCMVDGCANIKQANTAHQYRAIIDCFCELTSHQNWEARGGDPLHGRKANYQKASDYCASIE